MAKAEKKQLPYSVPERECRSSRLLVAAAGISLFSAATAYALSRLLEISPAENFLVSISPAAPAAIKLLISIIAFLLSLMLRSSLRMGREAWFCSIAHGKKPRAVRVFFWYKPSRCMRCVRTVSVLFLIGIAWGIVYLLPGSALLGACLYTVITDGMELKPLVALLTGSLLMLASGLIFLLVTLQRYFLVLPIIVKKPAVTTRAAISYSKAAMNRRCLKVIFFKLKFLPYFVLCLFIIPIFFVWQRYNRACIFLKYELLNDFAKRCVYDPKAAVSA